MSQGAGSFPPSWCNRFVRPLVVVDVEMSVTIGTPGVGMPADSGFGVKTGSSPPKGATLLALGSEQASSRSRPCSVARWW